VTMLFANGSTSKIPMSVDIFLTMNNKFEVSAEAKLALSYNQLTRAGVNVDLQNSDATKRLTRYSESYDPELYRLNGTKEPATMKVTATGELKGSVRTQMGIAMGLRFANIYPTVIEGYGALSLVGEVTASKSIDLNGETSDEFCYDLGFIPEVGVYAAVGVAFESEVIIDTVFDLEHKTGFTAFYNHLFKEEFDVLPRVQNCRSSQNTIVVKKTGQTKSYDSSGNEVMDGSLKDDGYYQKGITPNYTRDSTKEIVTDHVTGLMWQDDEAAASVKKPWVTQEHYNAADHSNTTGDTAMTYCSELSLGGYEDWRLPERKELQSLLDYGQSIPSINHTFKNTGTYLYWTSTISSPYNKNAPRYKSLPKINFKLFSFSIAS